MGFEYYSDELTEINYRGNIDSLWKADYAKIFTNEFNTLKLVKKNLYPYKQHVELQDCGFLLQKI
jgi:hypothetical protein